MASTQPIAMRNYYMDKYFGENRLFAGGVLISIVLFCVMFGVAFL
jgi:ech hydrogenase subunit A